MPWAHLLPSSQRGQFQRLLTRLSAASGWGYKGDALGNPVGYDGMMDMGLTKATTVVVIATRAATVLRLNSILCGSDLTKFSIGLIVGTVLG